MKYHPQHCSLSIHSLTHLLFLFPFPLSPPPFLSSFLLSSLPTLPLSGALAACLINALRRYLNPPVPMPAVTHFADVCLAHTMKPSLTIANIDSCIFIRYPHLRRFSSRLVSSRFDLYSPSVPTFVQRGMPIPLTDSYI